MFGYVRPVREELKCKDFDRYRATYCGLCGTLRQRYGWIAPMFLNFDFTFLALLLCKGEPQFPVCRGRCHANPFLKKTMCVANEALVAAADESVILTYWQLKDKVQDSGRRLTFWCRSSYRISPNWKGKTAGVWTEWQIPLQFCCRGQPSPEKMWGRSVP